MLDKLALLAALLLLSDNAIRVVQAIRKHKKAPPAPPTTANLTRRSPVPFPPTSACSPERGEGNASYDDHVLFVTPIPYPSHEQIARRAYQLWELWGRCNGKEKLDWDEAKHELTSGIRLVKL